ncbi:MAG: virulence protein [Nitrospirota bacterium]
MKPLDPSSTLPPDGGQFLVYQTEDGKLKLDVRFEGETVWLTQQLMAELFQTTKQNGSLHIQNVLSDGELHEDSVVKESLTTAADGELEHGATHKKSLSVRQEWPRPVDEAFEQAVKQLPKPAPKPRKKKP